MERAAPRSFRPLADGAEASSKMGSRRYLGHGAAEADGTGRLGWGDRLGRVGRLDNQPGASARHNHHAAGERRGCRYPEEHSEWTNSSRAVGPCRRAISRWPHDQDPPRRRRKGPSTGRCSSRRGRYMTGPPCLSSSTTSEFPDPGEAGREPHQLSRLATRLTLPSKSAEISRAAAYGSSFPNAPTSRPTANARVGWAGAPARWTSRPTSAGTLFEGSFNLIKQWRGLAARYDKLAIAYRSAAVLAAVMIWLRGWETRPRAPGGACAGRPATAGRHAARRRRCWCRQRSPETR